MTGDANAEQEKVRRFRDAALPCLDDVFALARYLMRNAEDAEDAVQECYLRALRHFDSYRGQCAIFLSLPLRSLNALALETRQRETSQPSL
jgi:DNA-directed RNA polymerase specialized sigma24 family protein